MDGTYGLHELLESDKRLTDALKGITVEYCFSCDEVLTLEVVGERVICELLNIFYKAISRQDQETIKNNGRINDLRDADFCVDVKRPEIWTNLLETIPYTLNRFNGYKFVCSKFIIDVWNVKEE